MEPAWSPREATSRTGTLRSAAPACPPCGTPHTIAVSCHRRHGQLVYTGKSFFLPFLFPPQHLCRHRSHRGKWLNSHCYLLKFFFNKDLWYPGKRKQQPLDKRGAGGHGKEFVQMFPADVRCSCAALLTAVLLDAEQLQHTHLGVYIMLHHSCFWRIDRAALFQNDVNLSKPA